MKPTIGRWLACLGNWIIDLGLTIREVGKAAAYARSHPTEIPKHED